MAILPRLVNKSFKGNSRIKPLFLLNSNIEQTRKVIYTRGLYGDANSYSDDVKEVEVEWALMFNNWLEAEAKKYGYPVYKIGRWNFALSDIIKLIK